MGTITVCALKKINNHNPRKRSEGDTCPVAANVIRPETAPLAVGLSVELASMDGETLGRFHSLS
jgi:hypothetical protein